MQPLSLSLSVFLSICLSACASISINTSMRVASVNIAISVHVAIKSFQVVRQARKPSLQKPFACPAWLRLAAPRTSTQQYPETPRQDHPATYAQVPVPLRALVAKLAPFIIQRASRESMISSCGDSGSGGSADSRAYSKGGGPVSTYIHTYT